MHVGSANSYPMGLWSKCRPDSQTQKVEASQDASTSSTLSPADVTENGLEDATFPQQQRFWQGGEYELLGSGIRYYKLGFIHVKVGCVPATSISGTALAEYVSAAGHQHVCTPKNHSVMSKRWEPVTTLCVRSTAWLSMWSERQRRPSWRD
jgi:hypothetical protein